jgi:hypothetical protein
VKRITVTKRIVQALGVLCLSGMSLTPAWALQAKVDPPDDLYARIKALTGPNPLECGRSQQPGDGKSPGYPPEAIQPSIECAVRSAKAKRTFWTFLRSVSADSWVAAGLYATDDGVIQYFTYTNGATAAPVLKVQPCGIPSVKTSAAGVVSIACSLAKP